MTFSLLLEGSVILFTVRGSLGIRRSIPAKRSETNQRWKQGNQYWTQRFDQSLDERQDRSVN